VKSFRRCLVVALLAGWLAPLAPAAARADDCCCPAGMHGACMRANATGCSLKRCVPNDGAALIAAKVVLPTAAVLPAPTKSGSATAPPVTQAPDTIPDPFDPPPRA
jgi:hypothetical protein